MFRCRWAQDHPIPTDFVDEDVKLPSIAKYRNNAGILAVIKQKH